MNIKEQIIQTLNEKYTQSKTNEVSINQNDVQKLNISEDEASRTLHLMQDEGLITIKQKSIHNNFSRYWEIIVHTFCIEYFENKKREKKTNRNNWIQFWIPLAVSIIGFIINLIITLSLNV